MKSALFVLFGCSTIFAASEVPDQRKALRAMVQRRHQNSDERNSLEAFQSASNVPGFSAQAQAFLRYIAAARKQGAGRKRRYGLSKESQQETAKAVVLLNTRFAPQVHEALLDCPRPALTALIRTSYLLFGNTPLDQTLMIQDRRRVQAALDPWFVADLNGLVCEYVDFSERQGGVRLQEYVAAKHSTYQNAPINDLTGLEKIDGIERVTDLQLSGNRLGLGRGALFSDQPRQKFSKVRRLNLQNNQLSRLGVQALAPFAAIAMLNLNGNNFTEVPDLGYVPRLQSLRMNRNLLAHFPKIVHARLQYLNLAHNMIAKMKPGSLLGLPKLTTIDLRGNPITELPADVQERIDAGRLKVMWDQCKTKDEGMDRSADHK